MADEIEIFHTLKTKDGSNTGVAPHQANEGDSPAAKDGIIAFGFKDSSGNIVLPQLNPEGAQVVTFDAGTTYRQRGQVASGSQTIGVRSQIAEATLTLSKLYTKLSALCSCRRDALFELVHIDDADVTPVETPLLDGIVAAGQYTINLQLLIDKFDTTGGTGTQKFVLYGTPLQKESDLRGSFSYNEVA